MAAKDTLLSFPFSTPTLFEPPEIFAELRDAAGLARVVLPTGDLAWLVTRYKDVRRVLAHPALSRAAAAKPGAPQLGSMRPEQKSMMAMDPPQHTRLRQLITPAFSHRRIDQLRPGIQRLTDELLDTMTAAGPPADLVAALSRPLPMLVICELLGMPSTDRENFIRWTENSLSLGDAESVQAGRELLYGYLAGLIEAKRVKPDDTLLSFLVTARASNRLGDGELVALAATLLTAGYHPVSNTIANATLMLLRHPEQHALLLRRPELVPSSVEELLRYTPGPVSGGTIRVATEDLWLGGTLVRAGEAVIPSTTAANRDPTAFDAPDRLDVARVDNPHVAFGPGTHHCVGASLARAELAIVFGALLRRFPGLRLAVSEEELTWSTGTMILGLTALPVMW